LCCAQNEKAHLLITALVKFKRLGRDKSLDSQNKDVWLPFGLDRQSAVRGDSNSITKYGNFENIKMCEVCKKTQSSDIRSNDTLKALALGACQLPKTDFSV